MSVILIDPSKYDFILKMLQNWQETAQLQENLLDRDFSEMEGVSRIRSSLEGCRHICESLGKMILEGKCQALYACHDENFRKQAFMAVSIGEGHIEINRLVTHPYNIFVSSLSQKEHSVRGSGSLLLRQAEHMAENMSKSELKLISTWCASSFYEKQGFENLGFSIARGGVIMLKPINKAELSAS